MVSTSMNSTKALTYHGRPFLKRDAWVKAVFFLRNGFSMNFSAIDIKSVIVEFVISKFILQLWAKSHFGPDYTLATDVWYLTLWTEQHFGSARLGPLHFGPCTLWLKTFWPLTFWLLTFRTEWHFGPRHFGSRHFGLWLFGSWHLGPNDTSVYHDLA